MKKLLLATLLMALTGMTVEVCGYTFTVVNDTITSQVNSNFPQSSSDPFIRTPILVMLQPTLGPKYVAVVNPLQKVPFNIDPLVTVAGTSVGGYCVGEDSFKVIPLTDEQATTLINAGFNVPVDIDQYQNTNKAEFAQLSFILSKVLANGSKAAYKDQALLTTAKSIGWLPLAGWIIGASIGADFAVKACSDNDIAIYGVTDTSKINQIGGSKYGWDFKD